MARNEEPNPDVLLHDLWMIYPYFVAERPGFRGAEARYRRWVHGPPLAARKGQRTQVGLPPPWEPTMPEELRQQSFGRWFHEEVRLLFFPEPEGVRDEDRPIPKFRWFTYGTRPELVKGEQGEKAPGGETPQAKELGTEASGGETPQAKESEGEASGQKKPQDGAAVPSLLDRRHRLGLVRLDRKGRPRLRLLPATLRVREVFLLAADSGVLLLVVRIRNVAQSDKAARHSLADAMSVNHVAAHADSSRGALAVISSDLIAGLTRRMFTEARASGGSASEPETAHRSPHERLESPEGVALTPAEAGQILTMSTQETAPFVSQQPGAGQSFPRRVMQSVSAAFRGLDVVAGSHGRIPIASHLLLPWDPRLEGSDAAETAALEQAYGSVEALAARGLFHPVTDKVAPLPLSELQAEEFQTVPVTGSRRFHVTCEGLLTWTYNRTGFDVSSWPERVAREYLLTFLLALTQAVTLQNISWRSYTRRDRRRDNEALIERFLDYSTDYDFAVVSQQFNIQRLYRCSRIALGVERIDKEVREELQAWIESETRKEQRSLNSIAVAALLGAVATVFVGLGVSNFNRDSNVAAWWGTSGPASPLWFWIPTLLVLAFSAVSRSVRRHLRRVWRLLWDR